MPALPNRGSHAERTRLAWSRTAIGFLGNAALIAIRVPHSAFPLLTWSAFAAAGITGVLVLVAAERRGAELSTLSGSLTGPGALRTVAARARLTVLGLAVCLLCVVVGLDVLVALVGQ